MSTNSTIVLKVSKDKKGKTYQYKTPNCFKYDTPSVTIPNNDNSDYVEVYVHWDGYPKGVGKNIINFLKDYENNKSVYEDKFDYIFENLFACGDMSTIGTPYQAWRGNEWEYTHPKFYKDIPQPNFDYQYLISDKNDNWNVEVRELEYDKSGNKTFNPYFNSFEEILKEE